MTKEEIIKRELFNIIADLKKNQAQNTDLANESISDITRVLQETAKEIACTSPEEVFLRIRKDYFEAVEQEALLSPGIATIIEDSRDRIYLSKYSGNIGDDTQTAISRDTRFDLASITKLFTVLEALKLNQDGLFDVNQIIKDVNKSPYTTLNVTIADLLRFKYELQTIGRIDEPDLTTAQFYRRLLKPKIGKNSHVYSDIPYIIVKSLMPNSRKFFTDYYEELGLLSLGYDTNGVITGGYDFDAVADQKARLMMSLGIQPGHAGLFGTADDLIKVFDALESGFLDKRSLDMLVSSGSKDKYAPMFNKSGIEFGQRPIVRGMGVYIEHPEGLKVSEVIPGLSKYAFAITGYTGGYVSYDVINGFASVILANPISIAATEAQVLVRKVPEKNKVLYSKEGTLLPKDTMIVSNFVDNKKVVNLYDPQGEHLETRTYTNLMNGIKINQLHTILKLRLTKRVAMALANSDLLIEHIEEEYNGGKQFMR